MIELLRPPSESEMVKLLTGRGDDAVTGMASGVVDAIGKQSRGVAVVAVPRGINCDALALAVVGAFSGGSDRSLGYITGWPEVMAAIENLAVKGRVVGANPVVSASPEEDCWRAIDRCLPDVVVVDELSRNGIDIGRLVDMSGIGELVVTFLAMSAVDTTDGMESSVAWRLLNMYSSTGAYDSLDGTARSLTMANTIIVTVDGRTAGTTAWRIQRFDLDLPRRFDPDEYYRAMHSDTSREAAVRMAPLA